MAKELELETVRQSKEGIEMPIDPEVVAALKLQQERHRDLERRVNGIEEIQVKLQDEMDAMDRRHTELQLDIGDKFYDLKEDISRTLPAALSAIPQSIHEEEERRNSRRAVTWLAVGGIGAVLGAIIAAVAVISEHAH